MNKGDNESTLRFFPLAQLLQARLPQARLLQGRFQRPYCCRHRNVALVILITSMIMTSFYHIYSYDVNWNIVKLSQKSTELVNNNFKRFIFEEKSLTGKVQRFNDAIQNYVRTHIDVDRLLPCDNITMSLQRRLKLAHGYTDNVWNMFKRRRNDAALPDWDHDGLRLSTTLENLSKAKRKNLKTMAVFDPTHVPSLVGHNLTVLALSARSGPNSNVVDVATNVDNYYECCISNKTKHTGMFHYVTGSMSPTLCKQECSSELSDINRAITLPDYGRVIDFTRVYHRGDCAFLHMPPGTEHAIADVTLYDSRFADILTTLLVVQHAVVLPKGQIRTTENHVIDLLQCGARSVNEWRVAPDARKPFRKPMRCEDEVFTITSGFSVNYYHNVLDEMTRLAPFVPFLKSRPNIVIHTGSGKNIRPVIKDYMGVFGLTHRVIASTVKARVLYRPQNNACFSPTLTNVQMTNALAHQYILQNINLQNETETNLKPIILFIRRRQIRRIVNENETIAVLEELASKTNRKLVIFDDGQLPTFNDTMELFYRADVILAPHGAGLSNILFCRPGATVIEVHCKGRQTHMCFRMMSLRLGLRYYAMETTASEYTFRCNESGVYADIEELRTLLDFVAGYLTRV